MTTTMNQISVGMVQEALKIATKRLEEENEGIIYDEKPPLALSTFSLVNLLVNILTEIDVPLSVSFINLFLSQRRLDQLTESFLSQKVIQEKFSVYVLGYDLKIRLKELDVKATTKSTQYQLELLDIIKKDLSKLKDLRCKFLEDKETEIPYVDFLRKYSSNKNKMKLSFIVRNSHALKLYKKTNNTYVRFITETEQVIQHWDCTKGFENLIVKCLKELLSQFVISLNQGILNSCFNFGHLVIDKRFLDRYRDVFQGSGDEGVTVKHNYVREDLKSSESKRTRLCMNDIKDAVDENRSILVLGNSSETPLFYYDNSDNSKQTNKVLLLEKLNEFITKEIEKIS